MNLKDILIALLIVIVWGVNFVALKLGLNGVPPMLMVCLRFLLSAVPLVFFVKKPNVPFKYLLAYALTVGVGQYSLLYGALKLGMPAGLSSVVMQLQAFFTLGAAVLFLRERVTWIQLVGIGISLVGLLLIATHMDRNASLLPLLMVVGAAASWGVGNVVTRTVGQTAKARGEQVDMFAFTTYASLIPILPMLALSLLIEGSGKIVNALTHLNMTSASAMLYTAYLSTIFGFVAWNKLIAKHGASQVAPFSLVVPFFGLSSTALALGETISANTLFAGVLILVGLAVNVFGMRLLQAWANQKKRVLGNV